MSLSFFYGIYMLCPILYKNAMFKWHVNLGSVMFITLFNPDTFLHIRVKFAYFRWIKIVLTVIRRFTGNILVVRGIFGKFVDNLKIRSSCLWTFMQFGDKTIKLFLLYISVFGRSATITTIILRLLWRRQLTTTEHYEVFLRCCSHIHFAVRF